MKNLLSRGSALAAILVLALIPASAQPSRDDQVRRIEINAQAIEAFDPREPSLKRFGRLTFRGGLVLEFQAPRLRRAFGAARRGRRRAFSVDHRPGPVAARAHRLSRQGTDCDRRRRDGADPRARRPAAQAPRLVRHRGARDRRRHGLCRHRARPRDRAVRLRQGRLARAGPAGRRAARHAAVAVQQEHRMSGGGAEGERIGRLAGGGVRARPR